jgi:hypothetical protein
MSKWSEYLRLLPEGLKNIPSIIEGVLNDVNLEYGSLDEDKREEIVRRRIICKGCPFMSENAKTSPEYKELTGSNYHTDRDDEHCTFCGCPIDTRTAALSKPCGINSWNRNHKDKPLTLKWEPYAIKSD